MNARLLIIPFFILAFLLFLGASPFAFAAEKPPASKEDLKRIQEELKGVKKKAREAGRQETSVLGELERMDKNLAQKRAEVRRLESKLDEVSRQITVTETEMGSKRAGLKVRESDLTQRLRAMYKTDRAGGPWTMLVSEDYGLMLKRYKYLSVLSQRDKRLMDGYTDDLLDLGRYKEKLDTQRSSYDSLKKSRDAEAAKAQAQESRKRQMLASIQRQKSSYEAMAKELEEAGRRMQELLRRLEEEAKARAKARPALPSSMPPLSAGLDWPVTGKVTGFFGRQKHPEYDTYIYKKGIEIQAAMGTEVRAVESAEVAFADWFRGLGLVAILRHGGDYYTVYAHLSELKVKTGDKVLKGQAIATLGDTGAPSGSSLYFEVRKGSEAQDPLRWLRRN